LLGCLYDAVLAPQGFQAFIEKMREVFDLKAVTMIIRHAQTQEVKGLWLVGLNPQYLESYALDYGREDMLARHIEGAPIAHFYASNLDVPHPEDFPSTRFFREWLAPQDIAYAAGAVVLQEGAWLTQLILQRRPSQPAFGRDEIDALNLLVPHLQRTLQMRERFAELQLGQNVLAGGLDVLAMPTLLFDEYGRVAHHNKSAALLLASESVLSLEDGNLRSRDAAINLRLGHEIGKAIRASRGDAIDLNSVVLLPRPEGLPLMLMIAPLQLAGERPSHGAALLFVFDPDVEPKLRTDLLRRLFLLTAAEAELAGALCCGRTLDEAALERGTSINTIRSQIRSIFLKTGTKRQPELVSLLLASPAFFLAQKH
jgi:DNA-binding CsgD family transcriptional regulator